MTFVGPHSIKKLHLRRFNRKDVALTLGTPEHSAVKSLFATEEAAQMKTLDSAICGAVGGKTFYSH